MAISASDVKHVAALAQLKLTPAEMKKFQKQLADILDYMEELSEVKTKDAQAVSQTTGLTNRTREDEVKNEPQLTSKEAISGTEKTHNDYFVAKRLIPKDES